MDQSHKFKIVRFGGLFLSIRKYKWCSKYAERIRVFPASQHDEKFKEVISRETSSSGLADAIKWQSENA